MDIPNVVLYLLPVIILVAIWDGVWRLIAMWHAARHNDKVWFICLAIFSTMAILPIIYLLKYRDEKQKPENYRQSNSGNAPLFD